MEDFFCFHSCNFYIGKRKRNHSFLDGREHPSMGRKGQVSLIPYRVKNKGRTRASITFCSL
ncbi:hypothetical protein COK19_08810 [Bacillus cereus]|nr:hypothetical protein COJ77_01135 [Bacillus cereus]PFR28494.1 hypothetical protein COK19_08810 [Bacillus cereus]PGZ19694.1 hypothetical protein COE46_03085 [Bacillus cereus]